MSLESERRQKSGQPELPLAGRGEAPRGKRSGEARTATHDDERSGNDDEKLMELVVERSNVEAALRRVKKNKGSPGIDGMTVDELPAHVAKHWSTLREAILSGSYQPQPVRRQAIPKKDGGVRELGIALSSDAEHIITPSVAGPKRALTRAFEEAGVGPKDIAIADLHATGTPGDLNELSLVEDYVGEQTLITARKGQLGHGMANSGGWELTALALGLAAEAPTGRASISRSFTRTSGGPRRSLGRTSRSPREPRRSVSS